MCIRDSHNPRSTVGTVTEIHDYLRVLFARAGTPYCPEHRLELKAQTVAQMVDHVLELPQDTRLMILAPVVTGRKGEQAELLEELRAQGFTRVRVDGKVHELDAAPRLAKNSKHTIEVVIDRLLSLIHISEPTRLLSISYAVFCLKKK